MAWSAGGSLGKRDTHMLRDGRIQFRVALVISRREVTEDLASEIALG